MSVATHDERRSFLVFLFFVIVTAGVISFKESSSTLGLLGIFWGVFGFLRLVHLTSHQYRDFPKIISLPSQILFGLARQQEERMELTIKRLGQPDAVFWMMGSLIFVIFAVFCSYFPTEISLIKTLQLKQEVVLDIPVHNYMDPFVVMKSLSYYGLIGIIVFSALSFSQSRTNIDWAMYSLLPVFMTAALFTLVFTAAAQNPLWPDLSVLKGGGLGQSDIMKNLAPEMMASSGTGLINRFTELGMAGAYGVYLLYIPAFGMMFKLLFDNRRTFFKPVIGILCLIFLVILDSFWISVPLIKGVMIIGLTLSALCWGSAGQKR